MGSFKLGGMTLSSLFKKPETLLYPVQKKEPPKGLKGTVLIDVDACILCGICGKTCPTGAIQIAKPDRSWSIDHFRCIQCGSCIRACPKGALSMFPHYTSPAKTKHVDSFTVPEREKPAKAARAES